MKAIVINKYGDPNVFHEAEIGVPQIKDDEILIKNYAFSINFIDDKIRRGEEKIFPSWNFPIVLGWDLAGIIIKTGKNIHKFKVGNMVYGKLDNFRSPKEGTYAQFVVTKEKNISLKPKNLSFIQAASVPMAGLTAWQVIKEYLKVKSGQKILIQGGSSGVGIFAIQIAKYIGAYVTTTTNPRNFKLVKRLGADQVIDFHKNLNENINNAFDYVFDTVGDIKSGLTVLKKQGQFITTIDPFKKELIKQHPKVNFFRVHASGGDLGKIGVLLETGKLHTFVTKVFSFLEDDIRVAHEKIQTKNYRGKLVVDINR